MDRRSGVMALWPTMLGRLALVCTLVALLVASLHTDPLEIGNAQQVTPTPTRTPTATGTATATATASPTRSPTPTASATATSTRVANGTPTTTRTPVRTATATPSAPATPTGTPTALPTQTATRTATPTVTSTPIPLVITDIAISSVTRSTATITWTTSEPSSSQVQYGTFAPNTFRSPVDASLVTAHRVVLIGLQAGMTYQFNVLGTTAAGVSTVSDLNALSTAPAGSGPEVVDLLVLRATSTTATLAWATSTGTVAQVEYGGTANYGLFTLLNVFTTPAQQLTLTNLRPANSYHFRIKAWDAQGGLGASADAMFSTAPAGLATLVGDNTVQTEPMSLAGGRAALYQYVASQSGLASVVQVYIDTGSTAPALRVALYSDQDGAPGTILSQGSGPALTPGWVSLSIPPVSLVESTRYWLGVLNPLGIGAVNLRQASSGGSSVSSAQTSLAAFPQPFVSGSTGARSPLSAFVQQVPPAITLTGPASGSLITGQAQLSALVDDDVPLARLQFFVDDVPVGPVVTAPPYSVNWSSAGLSPALPHTISARATDMLGRSGASGLVTVNVDNGPAISNITVGSGLTASSARISWLTDVASDGQVEYGTTTSYGLSSPVDTQMDVRHQLDLTSLAAGTVYHFRVRSRDANGAPTVSDDGVFFTAP